MDKIQPLFMQLIDTLYGPDKWWRGWAMVMTGCLLLCLYKPIRKTAGAFFVGIGICAVIWNWMQNTYKDMTPQETPKAAPTKRWLR